MSIRWKLILSYLIMLIVPLLTLLLTAMLLVVVFQGDLKSLRMVYETKIEGFEEDDFHRLIKHSIEQNPSLLTDQIYLNDLSTQLSSSRDTFLYVVSGEQVNYVSHEIRLKTELLSSLTDSANSGPRYVSPTKPYANNEFYYYIRYNFSNESEHPSYLYLITKVDPLIYFAKKYAPFLLVSAVVMLVLTNAVLTLYMSKRIIKPLMALRKSAMEFTDGRLESPVLINGKDEIGQLGKAFEELRTRLLHSIEIQAQYETDRKELIASISHDLKTPITSIRGHVDGLLEGIANSPEKIDKYMRTISIKAADMDRLIDELFLFSKLDLHRMVFSFESVNVHAFLLDWSEELEFDLEKEGVALQSDFQVDQTSNIRMDRDSFRRVLTNVIQNSLKFMNKEHREIKLFAATNNGILRLTVEDNGPGIPQQALPYIFERFYRAEPSRNTETGGSGLGLAIANRIVIEHGGTIMAQSTEGVGTQIHITLPVYEEVSKGIE